MKVFKVHYQERFRYQKDDETVRREGSFGGLINVLAKDYGEAEQAGIHCLQAIGSKEFEIVRVSLEA